MTLKELTKAKHEIAEKLPFIVKIFQKKVTSEEYLKYLYQMQPVYEALENKSKKILLSCRKLPLLSIICILQQQMNIQII